MFQGSFNGIKEAQKVSQGFLKDGSRVFKEFQRELQGYFKEV